MYLLRTRQGSFQPVLCAFFRSDWIGAHCLGFSLLHRGSFGMQRMRRSQRRNTGRLAQTRSSSSRFFSIPEALLTQDTNRRCLVHRWMPAKVTSQSSKPNASCPSRRSKPCSRSSRKQSSTRLKSKVSSSAPFVHSHASWTTTTRKNFCDACEKNAEPSLAELVKRQACFFGP